MSLFYRNRLQPIPDVPCTTWHNIRGQFRSIFKEEYIDNVEIWYNKLGSKQHREAFRRCTKSVILHTVKSINLNSLEGHKAKIFVDTYGAMLSVEGRNKVLSWAFYASESEKDDFRKSFTAIMEGTFHPESVTHRDFVPKDAAFNNQWTRKKVDWQSKKVHQHMQETVMNPMSGNKKLIITAGVDVPSRDGAIPKKRFEKPKNQFDGNALLKSVGLEGEDVIQKLRQKIEDAKYAKFMSVDPEIGCSIYHKPTREQNKVHISSRNRIIVPFYGDNTSSWKSTTRDTMRGFGSERCNIVKSENHASVSRRTASLGMVTPHPSMCAYVC